MLLQSLACQRPPRVKRILAIGLVIVGLIVSHLFSEQHFASAGSPDQSPIRVLSHRHLIEFGSRIVFELKVESVASPIVEIRAMFKPSGPDSITSYTYGKFTSGMRVDSRFNISTKGPSYYPPGVEFEVKYRITDAVGNSMETESVKVEYLDPGFEWQRSSDDLITVVYHDLEESLVYDLMASVSDRTADMLKATGLSRPGRYRAVLFNSMEEANRAFPIVSRTASTQHIFAGFAYTEYNLFNMLGSDPDTFVHELVHLFIGERVRSPLGQPVPGWLNEGLAVYMQNRQLIGPASIMSAAKSGNLLPLSAMNSVPGRRHDVAMFYPQAGAFVGYLITRFGMESIGAVIAGLDAGYRVDEIANQVFGTSLVDLDRAFRQVAGERRGSNMSEQTEQSLYPVTFWIVLIVFIGGLGGTAATIFKIKSRRVSM